MNQTISCVFVPTQMGRFYISLLGLGCYSVQIACRSVYLLNPRVDLGFRHNDRDLSQYYKVLTPFFTPLRLKSFA